MNQERRYLLDARHLKESSRAADKPPKRSRVTYASVLVLAGSLVGSPAAMGDSMNQWTAATNANWNATANWTLGTRPTGSEIAEFTNTGTTANVSDNSSSSPNAIDQLDYFGVTNTFSITKSGTITLTLEAGAGVSGIGLLRDSTSTGTQTIASPLVLGSSQTWQIDGSGGVTVTGGVSDGGNGFGLTKTGSGTLTFTTNTNTYGGQTSILNGSVVLSGNGSLGSPGSPVFVGDTSGTNKASLFSQGANTFSNNVIVQSGSSGTITLGSNGTGTTLAATWSGSVSLNTDVTIENTNANGRLISFTGGISDGASNFVSSNVKIAGPGRVIVSGGSAGYSGNTTISSGTLEIDSALLSAPAIVTVQNGALTGTGTISRSVTITSGGTIYGGTGSPGGGLNSGTLTITAGNTLSLQDGAALGYALPSGGSASSAPGVVADTLSVDPSDATRNVLVNIFDNGTTPDSGSYVLAEWDSAGPSSVTGWSFAPASAYTGDLEYESLGDGAGEILAGNLQPTSSNTPEPAGLCTAGVTSASMLLRRRRGR